MGSLSRPADRDPQAEDDPSRLAGQRIGVAGRLRGCGESANRGQDCFHLQRQTGEGQGDRKRQQGRLDQGAGEGAGGSAGRKDESAELQPQLHPVQQERLSVSEQSQDQPLARLQRDVSHRVQRRHGLPQVL